MFVPFFLSFFVFLFFPYIISWILIFEDAFYNQAYGLFELTYLILSTWQLA
jgi:hypothetical protein